MGKSEAIVSYSVVYGVDEAKKLLLSLQSLTSARGQESNEVVAVCD